MKIYINGPGHMIKMAAMPIYGKILKKSFSMEPIDRVQETWYNEGLWIIIFYINHDLGLTMTY